MGRYLNFQVSFIVSDKLLSGSISIHEIINYKNFPTGFQKKVLYKGV